MRELIRQRTKHLLDGVLRRLAHEAERLAAEVVVASGEPLLVYLEAGFSAAVSGSRSARHGSNIQSRSCSEMAWYTFSTSLLIFWS